MNTNTPEAVASNAELGIVDRLRANVDSWMPTQPHTREAYKLLTEAADEIDRLRAALVKIDAIRNDIIGRQRIGWSSHVYPLVEALGEAGFEGMEYENAKAQAAKAQEPNTQAERQP